jgi:peptidoglycan/xylan/chitin deacetylase (PgdA/CDA1 family)
VVGATAVPILTYHSLDESGSVISIPPDAFRRHMLLLRDRGFQALALGDLLDAWDGRRALPPRSVVLTFDDGFRNLMDHAAGFLADLGFRATVFVVAGHCGGRNDWPSQAGGVPSLPLCSWSELRVLANGEFEVGAHGLTHAPLIGAIDVQREVVEGKRRIEDELGRAVEVFAYPYGIAGSAARAVVAAHYNGACSVEMGRAAPGHDRHWLPRIDAYYLREPALFRLLGTVAGETYLRLRALGRRCRALFGARTYGGAERP